MFDLLNNYSMFFLMKKISNELTYLVKKTEINQNYSSIKKLLLGQCKNYLCDVFASNRVGTVLRMLITKLII